MNDMVERVARAILAAGEENDLLCYSNYPEADSEILARAAIAAMREPTNEMAEAGEAALLREIGGAGGETWFPRDLAISVYRSMINAAISPATRATDGGGK